MNRVEGRGREMMTQTVVTRAVCDTCGKSTERAGAEGSIPPPYWAHLRLSRRLPGSGWTNSNLLFEGNVCEECQEAILVALGTIEIPGRSA